MFEAICSFNVAHRVTAGSILTKKKLRDEWPRLVSRTLSSRSSTNKGIAVEVFDTRPSDGSQEASLAPYERMLGGGGQMGLLMRAFDWSATPVGPIEEWPQSLRTTVEILLTSRFPMFLWWGPELVQFYNDGYRPSLGFDRHPAALGARGREFWAEIWPTIGPQIDAVMEGESTWHEDHFVPINRNGRFEEVYWTYGYSPVRDNTGRIRGVLAIVQETTSRVEASRKVKISEARLADLFRQAPAFICVLRGPEHVFEIANEAFTQFVGSRTVLGRPVREVLPDAEGQGFFELLDRVLETGETFLGTEMPLTLLRPHDSVPEARFVTFIFRALVEADGSHSGVFVHGVDVTDQVRAREALEAANRNAEEARRRAEEANIVKTRFVASMSHELRTPLNAIGGYAQLLEMGIRGPITEAQREDIARIQHAQKHLLGLINSVLSFARLESGGLQYEMENVRVGVSLAEAMDLVIPQLRDEGIEYHAYCDSDSDQRPLMVQADAEKMRQILINLLTNAGKFTPRGGSVTLTCEAVEEGRPPGVVAIRVVDTGVGIAKDKLENIFEPFMQIGRAQTSTYEGVGLGLAISRDLARAMGGNLTVESEVGVGSIFTLTLPRA